MKKFFLATAATLALFPSAAMASVYNTTVATMAVAYCRYQMGYNTMEEVVELSEGYLTDKGYTHYEVQRALDAPTFDDDVVEAIYNAGGCGEIVN